MATGEDTGSSWSMSWADDDVALGGADERLRLSDVGKLARRTRRRIVGLARADDRPTLHSMLADHLAVDLEDLAVVEESWPSYDLVNVQVAVDAWLAGAGREHRLVGLAHYRHREFDLSDLLLVDDDEMHVPSPGNVTWVNLPSGPDGLVQRAVRAGLYLVSEDDARIAVLVLAGDPEMGEESAQVHVVADRTGLAATVAQRLRELSVEHNVYRGQVVSFGSDMFGQRAAVLQFHPRPPVTTDELVLPVETLETIRRQVVGVARHRERLLAARQHLKRGLLLYGPPGVGKTHTVRFLVGELTGVTVISLTGESLGRIRIACSVARTLQPAMVVVEDVDLIAEDRGMHPGQHPLLFELLNEMDGLAEDADVVFLLTTNRADLLEPALAARPGRVDQAVELELPDAAARLALLDLYRGGLVLDEARLPSVVERTAGVTASFLKELLRRSALIAADDEGDAGDAGRETTDAPLAVSADHLDAALEELLGTRNAMTRTLLGGVGTGAAGFVHDPLAAASPRPPRPGLAPPAR